MLKMGRIGIVCFGLAVFGLSESALACGGEEKSDKDEPQPSVLCGGEEKSDKDEPQPSVLCGGEEKSDKDEPQPSAV
jgi:hypothetical protein